MNHLVHICRLIKDSPKKNPVDQWIFRGKQQVARFSTHLQVWKLEATQFSGLTEVTEPKKIGKTTEGQLRKKKRENQLLPNPYKNPYKCCQMIYKSIPKSQKKNPYKQMEKPKPLFCPNQSFTASFQGCFNTPLDHTPKPLPTGHKGIPFIVG